MWYLVGGLGAAVLLLGGRLATAERDRIFWKHMALLWRKHAKTYYAQKTGQRWSQVEEQFRGWEPPSAA
jgi:hypothetical protein